VSRLRPLDRAILLFCLPGWVILFLLHANNAVVPRTVR
jgi:hypothetical protein